MLTDSLGPENLLAFWIRGQVFICALVHLIACWTTGHLHSVGLKGGGKEWLSPPKGASLLRKFLDSLLLQMHTLLEVWQNNFMSLTFLFQTSKV